MASYSLKHGYEIVEGAGYGSEELRTFVKSYPNLAMLLKGLNPTGGLRTLLGIIPEHITCSKLEKALCGNTEATEDVPVEDVPVMEGSVAPGPVEEVKAADSSDYHTWSNKQLKEHLRANKLAKACRAKYGDLSKEHMIAFLDGDTTPVSTTEEEAPVEASVEEVPVAPAPCDPVNYDELSPIKLYDLCKSKGIKVKTRQPKDYYIALLKENEPKEEATEAVGPEDWDDSDAVNEVTAAAPMEEHKKAKAKKAKKPVITADVDDDEWDI